MKTPASSLRRLRRAAFTLTELMAGMAISSVVLGGLAVSFISLQRSFEAANYQMTAQNDQLRVLDYIARDLRMTTAPSVLNGGAKLSLVVPPTTSSSTTVSLNLGPLLSGLLGGGSSSAAAANQTVAYYVEGGQLIREVNGAQTAIADTVASVQFTLNGAFMTTDILFTPSFSNSPTTADQAATRASNCIYLRNLN